MNELINIEKYGDLYFIHKPNISWRIIADSVIAINNKDGLLLTFNDIASLIWIETQSWSNLYYIIDVIQQNYDIDFDTALDDSTNFLLYLVNKGFIMCNIDLKFESNNGSDLLNHNEEEFNYDIKDICMENKIPIIGCIEVTEKCNLKCKHCYNSPLDKKELEYEEIKTIMDDLATLGCLDLLITGGEPLMRDDLKNILNYARKKNFSITLKTNANLIDNEFAVFLKNIFVSEVHISIYSMIDKEHDLITNVNGSLQKSLRGINFLKNNNIKVHIACPLTKYNYKTVHLIKEYADKNKIGFAFDPIITKKVNGDKAPIELRLTKTEINEIYDNNTFTEIIFPFLKNNTDIIPVNTKLVSNSHTTNLPICGAGTAMLFVTAYGDVYPCVALPINVGNIRKNALSDIWNNSQVLKETQSIYNGKFIKCISCDKLENCMRCPGIFYSDTGNIFEPSPASCLIAEYSTKSKLNKNDLSFNT